MFVFFVTSLSKTPNSNGKTKNVQFEIICILSIVVVVVVVANNNGRSMWRRVCRQILLYLFLRFDLKIKKEKKNKKKSMK